jgi:hypothetical protein
VIRGPGFQAAFSQKSDTYAFGCILYRMCPLAEPAVLDDIKPYDISTRYSINLLDLISMMLSAERDACPTASQVQNELKSIALQLFPPEALKCRMCEQIFPGCTQLSKHLKQMGYTRATAKTDVAVLPTPDASGVQSKAAKCRTCEETLLSRSQVAKD